MFKTIYNFEVRQILLKKSFAISTIVFCAIIFLLTFIPRIISSPFLSKLGSSSSSSSEDTTYESKYAIYVEDANIATEDLLQVPEFRNSKIAGSPEEVFDALSNEQVKKGLIIHSLDEIEVYFKKIVMYQEKTVPVIRDAIAEYKQSNYLKSHNVSFDDFISSSDTSELSISMQALEKNEIAMYPIAYASLFIMYMMILTYAQYTTIAVAREKNDRTMELLITSAKPSSLILGKVLASCTMATVKLACTMLAAFVGMLLNEQFFPMELLTVIAKSFTPLSLAIFILFFFFGYLMYNMMFASLGALVDRLEDINSVAQPLILLFVALFMACLLSINLPTSVLTEVLSMIPLSSPMVMFSSYVMRGTPLYMVGISFLLLVITTVLLCMLAGRIYRLGSLNYGNKIGFFKALKLIFSRS